MVEAEHAPRSPASLLDRTASQPWLHLLLQMPRHCLERSRIREEGNSYASARVHMAWVPEARLPKALTEGLFVCIEEGTSKHATSHDDDIGDQTREGCAHHFVDGEGKWKS